MLSGRRTHAATTRLLASSLKEFRELRAALDEHAIVAITDPTGKITYANDKFSLISKYSHAELIGQDHRIINSGHHPKKFFHALWAKISRGKAWHAEVKNRAKDGSFYWMATTVVPCLDEFGKPRQYISIRTDITASKQAADAAAHFASIVETTDEAIVSRDLDGRIRSWNHGAELLFGFSAETMIGTFPVQLMPAGGVDPGIPGIPGDPALREKARRFETVYKRKDGRLIDVAVTVSSIRDPSGAIVGVSEVTRDITERIKGEAVIHELNTQLETKVRERTAKLAQMVEELEAFSYSVSHDLRSPLRVLDGYARALREDYADKLDLKAQGYLTRISRAARNMDFLTRDVLAYSQVSRDDLALQPVSLDSAVLEAIDAYPGLQAARDSIRLRAPLGMCLAHGPSLAQCLSNVLENAVKFASSERPLRIEIRSEHTPERVRVFCEDNGIGVDPSQRERIFGLFERAVSKEIPGTGLGLAMVRKAAARMRGTVGVEPGLPHGSVFWLDLPAVTAPPAPPVANQNVSSPRS